MVCVATHRAVDQEKPSEGLLREFFKLRKNQERCVREWRVEMSGTERFADNLR